MLQSKMAPDIVRNTVLNANELSGRKEMEMRSNMILARNEPIYAYDRTSQNDALSFRSKHKTSLRYDRYSNVMASYNTSCNRNDSNSSLKDLRKKYNSLDEALPQLIAEKTVVMPLTTPTPVEDKIAIKSNQAARRKINPMLELPSLKNPRTKFK